ncbi:MAG TPA: cyclic nucleotide-binding domain-containing protein [Acidimicrobiia bacterium]|jgi:CRP-like cAMP-binding protein
MTDTRPDPQVLRDLPLFAQLSDDELTAIAAHAEERVVHVGERLTHAGASGYFFFVIEEGTASVERDGAIVATLGAGEFFGEGSILSPATMRRNATVTAQTPMRVFVMFGADFAKLCADSPAVGSAVEAAMRARSEVPRD